MLTQNQLFNIEPTFINFQNDEWLKILKQPLKNREHYERTLDHFQYGQLVGQFLGINESEEKYFDLLYDLANDNKLLVHVLHEELMRNISKERLQSIYQIYLINQEQHFSSNRIVAFLERLSLIPKYHNKALDSHIRKSFVKTLEAYKNHHDDGLGSDSFRRVLTDLIKWNWNHLDPWLKEISLDDEVPRILWYGNMNESQRYFLYFLMNMGWDLLIFQPNGIDSFQLLNTAKTEGQIQIYQKNIEIKPFPKRRTQKATVAYQASNEINKLLHHDQSDLYKPWQYKNHIPYSVSLKTIYDELFLLLKEPAFIRPNFRINNDKIYIPVVFSKIAGITEDTNEYWDRLNQITEESDLTLFIKSFPFSSNVKKYTTFYQASLSKNGRLDPNKIISNPDWKYKHLHNGLQLAIASVIIRYCENPLLKRLDHEDIEDVKTYLFSQAVSLPSRIIRLLQNFDYSQEIPRIVFYHNENNGKISRADAALLLFLHEFGVDILVFNPSGQNDLEYFINESDFDTHWLDEMVFNQAFRETNIFHRFSNNLFKNWKE